MVSDTISSLTPCLSLSGNLGSRLAFEVVADEIGQEFSEGFDVLFDTLRRASGSGTSCFGPAIGQRPGRIAGFPVQLGFGEQALPVSGFVGRREKSGHIL